LVPDVTSSPPDIVIWQTESDVVLLTGMTREMVVPHHHPILSHERQKPKKLINDKKKNIFTRVKSSKDLCTREWEHFSQLIHHKFNYSY